MACVVVATCAAGGVVGALMERSLPPRPRLATGGASAAVLVTAIQGWLTPRRVASILDQGPTTALILGAVPVLAAPLMGRRYTALHMLSLAGAGVSAAVLGRRRHRVVAGVSAAYWIAHVTCHARSLDDLRNDEKIVLNVIVIPLSFWAVIRLTPDILAASRELAQLDAKLERARARRVDLEHYAELLDAALTTVRRGLERARPAIDAMEAGAAKDRAEDTLIRAASRLDERMTVLDVASRRTSAIQRLVEARTASIKWLSRDELPQPLAEIDPNLTVTSSRVLSLLGATVTTGLSNVLRHAEAVTTIRVMATAAPDDRVELRITNDGRERADDRHAIWSAGDGLRHLRWQAQCLDGDLVSGPAPGGGWDLRLHLPVSRVVALGDQLTSRRMVALVDDALRMCMRSCGVMIVALVIEGRQLEKRHLGRTRVLAALTLLAYEAAEQRGLLHADDEIAASRSRSARWLLGAVAVVSALSPHHEHALWSGWASFALSRHGLTADRRELVVLTTAHAAAIVVSYRGNWRGGLVSASHQVATTVVGPASIAYAVTRARAGLEHDERELQHALSDIAQLYDLAESFHTSHPVTAPMSELKHDVKHDPIAVGALNEAERALRDAAQALPRDHDASGFADEFARTLASRIWPAAVLLVPDDDTLNQFDREAITAMEFRRHALDVADRLGDRMLEAFPADWLARPILRSVTLRILAVPITDTILMEVIPNAPGAASPASVDALAHALAHIDGTLNSHEDGRITLRIHAARYRSTSG